MVVIDSITIKYFRSIYTIDLSGCKDITVFTGLNDAGKSNILKALNLFFNNKTDWETDYDFQTDYNIIRKRDVKESIREQQYISITVRFQRGERMLNSLPPSFSVTRRWDLHDNDYEQTTDVHRLMEDFCKRTGKQYSQQNTKTFLSTFLNKIKYVYVPAIKDSAVFDNVISMLQENLFKKGSDAILQKPISEANDLIAQMVKSLQGNFKKSTGISSTISIPYSLEIIKGLLKINTSTNIMEENVMLEKRGDGIRAHYIPQILDYVAQHSNEIYIWGFEEPENSFEYKRCMQMATEFTDKYYKSSQVFLTSHSPAFYIDDLADRKKVFRVRNCEGKTIINTCNETLDEELGYAKLYEHFVRDLALLQEKNENRKKQIDIIEKELSEIKKPIVLTEGITDSIYLKIAVEKLDLPEFRKWIFKRVEIDNESGSSSLIKVIKALEDNISQNNLTIAMFDRDEETVIGTIKLREVEFLRIKKNLYAFSIPVPHDRKEENDISIEHYFSDDEIKTEIHGKRLFLGNEFYLTGVYKKTSEFYYKHKSICETIKIIEHETKTFVTDYRGEGDYSISKHAFASCVESNEPGFDNFDFSQFARIFEIFKKIQLDNEKFA